MSQFRLRTAGSLAFASVFALGLAFVTNILITAAVTDEEYGSYRLAINTATFLVGLCDFGLQVTTARCLALAADIEAERHVLGIGISIIGLILLGVTALTAVAGLAAWIFDRPLLGPIGSAALLILPLGLQRSLVYLLRGSARFVEINIQVALPQVVMVAVWFGLVKLGSATPLGASVAVGVYCLAFAVTHILSLLRLKPVLGRQVINSWRQVLRRNQGEGWEVYKGALVGVVTADLVLAVVGFIVDKGDYGVYALAWSLAAPLTQIPLVLQVMHFRSFARATQLAKRNIVRLFLFSLISLLALVGAFIAIKPIIYGDRYEGVTQLLLVLGFSLVVHSLGDYVNSYRIASGDSRGAKRAAYSTGAVFLIAACLGVFLAGVWGLAIARLLASAVYLTVGLVPSMKGVLHAAR